MRAVSRLVERMARVQPWTWRLLAVTWIAYVCARTWWQHSLVLDGVRWFWLDDDQMVSMRYARNLVAGHGLVFNPGERVEGYTNPLWTALMAVAHVAVRDPTKTSLFVGALALVSACVAVIAADRLLEAWAPEPGLARVAMLAAFATSIDLLYWTAHGFETPLLTALVLVSLVAAHRGRVATACAVASLVPLVRGDAVLLWGVCAAAVVAHDRSRAALCWLAASLVPALGHLALRRAYYGDWLPNTFYMKALGVDGRLAGATSYALGAGRTYAVAIVLALYAAWRRRGPLAVVVTAALVAFGLQVLVAGGDTFSKHRFFAPVLPIVLAGAMAGALAWARRPRDRAALGGLVAVATVASSGAFRRSALTDLNGSQWESAIAAALIAKNARPDARLAVLAAGTIPYFSGRPTLDLLGKTDRTIARLPGHRGARHGHRKWDHAWSLATRPDFVITSRPRAVDVLVRDTSPPDVPAYWHALMNEPAFRERYEPNVLPDATIARWCGVYVASDSPDRALVPSWRPVDVRP